MQDTSRLSKRLIFNGVASSKLKQSGKSSEIILGKNESS